MRGDLEDSAGRAGQLTAWDREGQGRVQVAGVWHRKLAYRGALTETGKADDGKALEQRTNMIPGRL